MGNVSRINYLITVIILTLNLIYTQHALRASRLISYSIPEMRPLKKALGYFEDTYLNFTELTTKHGYQSEEHSTIAEDGYILTIFRILPKCKGTIRKYPVLLMHGLLDTSDAWILAGQKTGIGYMLSNNCYDVWVANHRGNRYSRRHISFDPDKDIQFWNYSFDEHGYYDVPATIDYILQMTHREKLNYIGHSQGTTDFFAMTSLRPDYNKKLQVSIQLAPVAWLKNIISPIPKILAFRTEQLKLAVDSAGYSELLAKHQLTHFIIESLCQISPSFVCGLTLHATTGYVAGSIPDKTLAVAFGHLLSGTSTKSLAHFGQIIQSKKFQRYDEGSKGNIKRYARSNPPEYNISLITSPVVLITARKDWLSSLEDVEILSARLPNLLENYLVPIPKWSHNNHLWGSEAPHYVFPKMLQYLTMYN